MYNRNTTKYKAGNVIIDKQTKIYYVINYLIKNKGKLNYCCYPLNKLEPTQLIRLRCKKTDECSDFELVQDKILDILDKLK